MGVSTTGRALLIVDLQHDFGDPAGSLYVQGAAGVLDAVLALIHRARAAGDLVAWSQDWHPSETPHFVTQGGVWPVHCVAGTPGAELLPAAEGARQPDDILIRKGVAGEDGYSAFSVRDPRTGEVRATGLAETLKARGVNSLTICGLATDWCVKASALDALAAGFSVELPTSASAGVELQPGDTAAARAEIAAAGGVLC
ncbi:MAG: isochorismatase family protein [Chloroflexi bacterium]|jgi:nicotinamidase/pyrazinamidase|nr:MAG: isochorismatase family protein [Chloroflexota bacterium]RLT28671.1 MAG: isochorismatase family protein [Chloroflexota bacterium]